jgi:hypothetical protein
MGAGAIAALIFPPFSQKYFSHLFLQKDACMPLLAAGLQLSTILSNCNVSPSEKAVSSALHDSIMRSACSCVFKEVRDATEA